MKSTVKKLKDLSPTILTCIGAVGVVATAVLSVKVTPKALCKIRNDSRQNHDGDAGAYTKTEAIASAWFYYIPAVITGASTIICIFGANVLNKHQQAVITSAYALLNNQYNEYKDKLKEIYGDEAHKNIMNHIVVEKAKDTCVSAPGIIGSSCLEFGTSEKEITRTFYDTFSQRYFESTISKVLQAEYHLNRNFSLGGGASINEFYEFLGIEPIESGDDIVWDEFFGDMYWIDFNHYTFESDDGMEILTIEYDIMPKLYEDL